MVGVGLAAGLTVVGIVVDAVFEELGALVGCLFSFSPDCVGPDADFLLAEFAALTGDSSPTLAKEATEGKGGVRPPPSEDTLPVLAVRNCDGLLRGAAEVVPPARTCPIVGTMLLREAANPTGAGADGRARAPSEVAAPGTAPGREVVVVELAREEVVLEPTVALDTMLFLFGAVGAMASCLEVPAVVAVVDDVALLEASTVFRVMAWMAPDLGNNAGFLAWLAM